MPLIKLSQILDKDLGGLEPITHTLLVDTDQIRSVQALSWTQKVYAQVILKEPERWVTDEMDEGGICARFVEFTVKESPDEIATLLAEAGVGIIANAGSD